MNRRQVLIGLVATPVIYYVGSGKQILYGDGTTDDSVALQAWFNGESVYWPDGLEVGDSIEYKLFKLGRRIEIPNWSTRNNFSYNYLSRV